MSSLIKLQLVGLTEEAAISLIREAGNPYRVVKRDGHAGIITRDFNMGRYNLEIYAGRVTSVHMG